MKSNNSKSKRGFILAVIAVLVFAGTIFLLWQRYGPRSAKLNPAKLPEELVSVRSDDDILSSGAMFTPQKDVAKPIAVIWVHGWGVNFYQPAYVNIGRELAARGYTCITANTRMHDLGNVLGERNGKRLRGGGYWGVASDEVRDLAAWIDFAEQKGFKKVVLVGHSAGWAAVRNYQSHKEDRRVIGVVLASGAVRAETRPTDMKMFNLATNLISIDRADDLLRIPNRPFPSFISAATFADIANTPPGQKDFFGVQYKDPDVTRIRCPLLAFFGTREAGVGTEVDLELLKNAVQRLPIGPARLTTLMIERADHMYAGEESQVADTISQWADSLTVHDTTKRDQKKTMRTHVGLAYEY